MVGGGLGTEQEGGQIRRILLQGTKSREVGSIMRKLVCVALAASLVLALAPSTATANRHRRPPPQEEQGTIFMPSPFPFDLGACFAGLHRRLLLLTQGNNQGWFGYHFEIEEHTWKRNFVLEATGGSGYVDLDLYFYLDDFGGPENFLDDPVNASPPPSQDFTTREEGGEAGKVPEGAKHAIVCLYGGDQGFGYNAEFEYRAGRGVRLPRN
jgi:hypothetical protein